jgi:hypothetical protein
VSPRPKITNPHPISPVGNRHLRIPVAKIAVEKPLLMLPADAITNAPPGHHARGQRSGASAPLLARSAGLAPWRRVLPVIA